VISSLLLAAGLSHRYGGEKLEALIQRKRLIDWAIDHLWASVIDEVIIVVNQETAGLISWRLLSDRVKKAVNPHPSHGMASSILCGLELCNPKSGAVLIAHADMPAVRTEFLNRLASQWEQAPNHIVAPRFKGQQGNPVIIPRIFWEEIRALRGDVGCKSILNRHPDQIEWVDIDDEAVLLDIDFVEDLERLRARWD
jgi:molybdenum cofactor cytidylyltransferase